MEPVYEYLWRNKWLTSEAKTIDDMIETFYAAACFLEEMKDAGITLDPESSIEDDYASFITTDPEVAKKFEFEILDYDDDDDEEEDLEAEVDEDEDD